jgi:hypothetical protein
VGPPTGTGSRYGPAAYEMLVLAADVGDVVVSVGGWLCDRALAGWRITAAVPEDSDSRPFDILGVKAISFESACAVVRDSPPHALAVASLAMATDEFVQSEVRKVLHKADIEVAYWGDSGSSEDDRRGWVVQHRLSDLARAFKSQALKAAFTAQLRTGPTEVFRSASSRARALVLPTTPRAQGRSVATVCTSDGVKPITSHPSIARTDGG